MEPNRLRTTFSQQQEQQSLVVKILISTIIKHKTGLKMFNHNGNKL